MSDRYGLEEQQIEFLVHLALAEPQVRQALADGAMELLGEIHPTPRVLRVMSQLAPVLCGRQRFDQVPRRSWHA